MDESNQETNELLEFIKNQGNDSNSDTDVEISWGGINKDDQNSNYKTEAQNLPSDVTNSKQLIADLMSKRFEEEKKLKEKKAIELSSRAKHHEQFSQYYNKISREFLDKAKEENISSINTLNDSLIHEKESTEYATKAKEIVKGAWEQENKEIDYVNKYRKGYWDSNVANVKSVVAFAQMRNHDAFAKQEFIKSFELEKIASLLENEAEDYEDMGKVAEENSLKENATSRMKEETAQNHHNTAEHYFLKKVVGLKGRAKDEYTKYLEYLLKAEKEHELAREEQLKAAYEIKLTNAYVQKAQQNSAFANVAKSRLSEDKLKAKESAAGLYRPRDAEILVASKVFEEKSVEVIP
ncbi:hypothetical protein L9F63_020664 [Diploptera punctata]|uniref:Uncharacterized protein n=1 Tax=Diploptera punctata TaxID=6984 RepID=A0AAD7ZQS8_DIPPU|nr:hypothetical protein L9F63_020664 [Diploptera punctata]